MCIVLSSKAILTKNNNPITTSRKVCGYFTKRHDNVMRDILSIKETVEEKFWVLNYEESTYKIRGKNHPCYNMTKNGFILLVMGFTGKKAMKIKTSYIDAFDEMVEIIKTRLESKVEHHLFSQAIASDHEEPKGYHFSNEYNMIYRIMFGMSGKKYKEFLGLSDKTTTKEILGDTQIHYLMQLQKLDEALMAADMDFQDRKVQLTNFYKNMKKKRLGNK